MQVVQHNAYGNCACKAQPVSSEEGDGCCVTITDRAVLRALNCIHTRYPEPLCLEDLAREAGLSRTVLRERFCALLRQPPMRYCTNWRLRMSANLLRDGRRTAGDIAHAVGFGSEAAFSRAFRRRYGMPPVTWAKQQLLARPGAGMPRQVVRYCYARDGTKLAWSATGDGFPLVKTANWLNHLEFDWQSPVWHHWLRELTRENCLIRYDERGNGLSDRNVADLSLEAFIEDLEAVVEASGVERFDLLGISQGASVAIAYSLRHPCRIRRMVLLGGYARGWRLRLTGEDLARRQAMVELTRTGWGSDTPAFRQMFTSLYIPGGTPEQIGWWNELQRVTTSPAEAERLQLALGDIDVSGLLTSVTVPTMVAHATRDHVIPISAGIELARSIEGAEFLPLDSENHVLLEHEPAWPAFTGAFRNFLRQ